MIILETLVPVFLLICLGKFLSHKKILSAEGTASIKNICVNIFLPVVAFDSLLHGTYTANLAVLMAMEILALGLGFGAGFLLRKFFEPGIRPYIPFAMTTFEGGTLGWALVAIIVGQKNLYYIVSMDIFCCIFSFSVMAVGFKMINGEKLTKKEIVFSMIKNPLVISVILGFACGILGVAEKIDSSKFASIYSKLVSTLSVPLTPLILICIGSGLVFDKKLLLKGAKFAVTRYFVQAIVTLIVFAIIQKTIGLNKILCYSIIMYFCCPPSFLISVFAQKKEGIEFSSAVLSLMIIVTLIVFSVLAATF